MMCISKEYKDLMLFLALGNETKKSGEKYHPNGEKLYDYVLGMLDSEEHGNVKNHILSCKVCFQEVLMIRKIEGDLDQELLKKTEILTFGTGHRNVYICPMVQEIKNKYLGLFEAFPDLLPAKCKIVEPNTHDGEKFFFDQTTRWQDRSDVIVCLNCENYEPMKKLISWATNEETRQKAMESGKRILIYTDPGSMPVGKNGIIWTQSISKNDNLISKTVRDIQSSIDDIDQEVYENSFL